MSIVTVCDACGEPIQSGRVEWAGGDYHDTPQCIGAVQEAFASAVAEVREQHAAISRSPHA